MIRLVVFDMNGTLASKHTNLALAAANGRVEEAEEILRMRENGMIAMGDIPSTRLLRGLSVEKAKEVVDSIPPVENCKELITELHKRGIVCAIVTSGYTLAAESFAKRLNIDHVIANELIIQNGKLTGKLIKTISTQEDKVKTVLKLCKKLSLKPEEVAVIGDSLSDVKLFDNFTAFAYNPKKALKNRGTTIKNMLDVLDYL